MVSDFSKRENLLAVEDVHGVEVLEGEENVSRVKLRCVLLEPPNLTQVEEEFATGAVLEAEIELALRLERVVHLDDKLVIDAFLQAIGWTR